MRTTTSFLVLSLSLLAFDSAAAQDVAVQWRTDLESAKAEARQTGRPVLVHFWTPDCKPCAALEHDVFSQMEVVSAMQQKYVPVKINALDSRSTADELGVTRVPTDVILTPEGRVLDRSISPNSPMAYISHLSKIASAYRSGAGSAFDAAVARAPFKVPNEAYAQLNIPGKEEAQAAELAPATAPPTAAPSPTAIANPYTASSPAGPTVADPAPSATAAGPASTANVTSTQNPAVGDRYAMNMSVAATPTLNPYTVAAAPQTSPAPAVTQQIPVAPIPAAVAGGPLASNPIYPPSAAGTAPVPGVVQQQQVALPQLPPGSAPLGFDGFCPVTMKRQWQWAQGDIRFGAEHRGRTYLFVNEGCRDEFLANPDSYSPALSGMDPVLHLEQSQSVPGKRQYALEFKGQFYLFSSEQTLNRFWQNADQYSAGVQQAMQASQGRILR